MSLNRKHFIFAAAFLLAGAARAALVSIPGGLEIPNEWHVWFGQPSYQSYVIDAATEKVEVAFQIPKTGTISKIGFRTGAVTTSDTLAITLETINASGFASGTLYGGSSTGTVSSLVANTTYTVTLGSPASAIVGDTVVAVIRYNSYVAGNLNIVGTSGAGLAQFSVFPYVSFNGTGSLVKQSGPPVLWPEYNDGTYSYIPQMHPWSAITTTSVASNTAVADEYAMRFTLAAPGRLAGVGCYFTNAGANFDVNLYAVGGATTTLQTYTASSLNVPSSNARFTVFMTSTTVNLTANTVYRLSIRPKTTTAFAMYTVTYPTTAQMDQTAGGQNFYLSTTVDQSGIWTDTTNKRPLMSIILDQISDGNGAGVSYGFSN